MHKKMPGLLIAIFFCFSAQAAESSKAGPAADIEKEFRRLASQHNVKIDDLGMRLTMGEGDDLQVLMDVGSHKAMIPASVTKVATASTVLSHFPAGSKFKTQLLLENKAKDGVVKGPLYLKGGGDPSFVSENMWFLVNAFKRNQIRKIDGDIVVDDTLFDRMRFDTSRQEKRVDRAYDAPVGAMSFNWNSVNIFVRPGAKGESAEVFVDPENEYVRLINHSQTSSKNENKLIVDRSEDTKFDGDVIRVSGSIGKNFPEQAIFKNITQPDLWSGYNLKSFLAQRGIIVNGVIKSGKTPDSATVVAESESKAIEQILADMNKFSNNYVAEMLTKDLGALHHTPASLADGMKLINDHLLSLQIDSKEFKLQSPSGLTNENKLSSYALWRILQHLRNDFQVQPEFLTSLPIAGIDGTLKKRMKATSAERWVRAKTGYINNVVSLAGYAGRKDGKVLIFSFIYNGSTDEAKVRSFFDQLLIYLVK